jgi:hypothetical protein
MIYRGSGMRNAIGRKPNHNIRIADTADTGIVNTANSSIIET